MTRMLASISNVHEALRILETGVDIMDIKDPDQGVLGDVKIEIVREITKLAGGRALTSATIGDQPLHGNCITKAIAAMSTTGVDIIKVGIFGKLLPAEILDAIGPGIRAGGRIVLVFFADYQPLTIDFRAIAAAGVYGVMLDTADKTGGSLRTIMKGRALAEFIRQARSAGLLAGLAGSLRLEDIAPLLALSPDYLGFRGALCVGQQRNRMLDINAVRAVRALIPVKFKDALNKSVQDLSEHEKCYREVAFTN